MDKAEQNTDNTDDFEDDLEGISLWDAFDEIDLSDSEYTESDEDQENTPLETPATLLFDDEPLESVLYGAPSAGSSPTDCFSLAEPALLAIEQSREQQAIETGLQGMATLLGSSLPIQQAVLADWLGLIRSFMPMDVPCPIITHQGMALEQVLKVCFELGRHYPTSQMLMESAGNLLHRYYEGTGRYLDAIALLRQLHKAKQRKGDTLSAVDNNNLGFDYLLAGHWEQAMNYFWLAIAQFTAQQQMHEVANAQANLLYCEVEMNGLAWLMTQQRALLDLVKQLRYEWRVRKPLLLFARLCEWQGEYRRAIRHAQLAVAAGRQVPSQLHRHDQAYLTALQANAVRTTLEENRKASGREKQTT